MGKYIVLLYLLGIIFVLLEIYLPGGILGTIGFICLLSCIGLSFTLGAKAGVSAFFIVLFSLAASVYLVIKYLPESAVGRRLFLYRTLKNKEQESESLDGLIGRQGIAMTDLRPSGTARIAEKRRDVVTQGDYIDKDRKIEVIAIEGNRIIVKAI